jgi:hypothetical protein
VASGSRTEANLIRRQAATVLYLDAGMSVSIQARAGKARVSRSCPEKRIFPLRVVQVKEDRPLPGEASLAISNGPRFGGAGLEAQFSAALFHELSRA